MSFLTAAACLLFLTAHPVAAEDAPVMKLMPEIKVLGEPDWGHDGYFKLKWTQDVPGRFAGVDAAPSRRELWVVSSDHYNDDRFILKALDARGDTIREAPVEARVKRFRVWDDGGKLPRLAVMDDMGLAAFDAKDGKKLFSYIVPRTVPSDLEPVGKVLVASYGYGDFGLRAVDGKGRAAWQADFIPRCNDLFVARMSGRPVAAAADGLGKIFLVDAKGKLLDRVLGSGNMDRVTFSGENRMFGLDSGAGSWTESLALYSRSGKGKQAKWTLEKQEELGPITATALAAGRFGGEEAPQLAVGTDNGWVFLFSDDGRVLTQARFRGKISSLHAVDLDGDGHDELVVAVSTSYSGKVYVFSRPTSVSAR